MSPLFPVAVLASLYSFELLAQTTVPEVSGWVQIFVNLGVAGYMIWWFTTRIEVRLTALERAAERTDRIRLLALSSDREVPTPIREEAKQMLKDMEAQRASP